MIRADSEICRLKLWGVCYKECLVFALPFIRLSDKIIHPYTKYAQGIIKVLMEQYDEIVSWSELYDNATIETKKMIVNSMIKRIDVFRGV